MQHPPESHKVIRLHHPGRDVRVEHIPTPRIERSSDAIIKVHLAGLCGSDMHTYRGHSIPKDPFVMGHEFVGEVVVLGDDYTNRKTPASSILTSLTVGDLVVSPFTSSCGICKPCRTGFTSRCVESLLFGHPLLPGAQAQYVRVPNAAATLFKIPPDNVTDPQEQARWRSLAPESLILLADILPTGCFAALQALQHPNVLPYLSGLPFPYSSPLYAYPGLDPYIKPEPALNLLTPNEKNLTLAIVGLGPVGLCSLVALLHLLEKHKCQNYRIMAIDLVESRREKAEAFVRVIAPTSGTVEVFGADEAKKAIRNWGDGIGCHAVLEVVGYNPALELAYELIRPFGVIASVGVHQTELLPLTGSQCYNKNISVIFGRCPVRAMFPMALEVLLERQDVFAGVGTPTSLVERIVEMEAEVVTQTYVDFDKGICGKALFDPWK